MVRLFPVAVPDIILYVGALIERPLNVLLYEFAGGVEACKGIVLPGDQ